jgi:hypothetical protein
MVNPSSRAHPVLSVCLRLHDLVMHISKRALAYGVLACCVHFLMERIRSNRGRMYNRALSKDLGAVVFDVAFEGYLDCDGIGV